MRKLTTEQWIEKARKVHGDRYDYSKVEYKGADEKVCIVCHEKDENEIEHGEFWQRAANHVTLKRGCPKCNGGVPISKEEFIKRASKLHNNKYNYSKSNYINTKTKIEIMCPKHSSFWQEPENHMQGDGCPECGKETVVKKLSSNTEEFIRKARLVHGNKYNYSKVNYINSENKVEIICPTHGSFWQNPTNHLNECGCPKCTLKSQTKLYERLKETFLTEEILFEIGNSVVSWLGLQRFDIYFPKYNVAIEYNGRQHYVEVEYFGGKLGFENTLKRDELKRQKCKENSCTLFEVKYDYTEEDYQKLVKNIQNIINNYDRSKEN